MKKLFIILSLLIAFVAIQAQTVVKEDVVKTYTYTDTLTTTDSMYSSTTYYVKEFAVNVRWQLNADSISSGYTDLRGMVLGSLDNSNWFSLGDTLTLKANGADSDKVLYTSVYYNYLKPKVWAADSTQYTEFNWKFLIDK